MQGIKIKYICGKLNLNASYFNDLAKGNTSISEERIKIVAEILQTTPEYLRDETDEPFIIEDENKMRPTSKDIERIVKTMEESKEFKDFVNKYMSLPPEGQRKMHDYIQFVVHTIDQPNF